MPLKNYTTTVEASKTIGEIQAILMDHGVRSISFSYDANRKPSELEFAIEQGNEELYYRLPANAAGVLRVLVDEGVPAKYRTDGQALRIAWRNLKDWLDAQTALVECGQVKIDQIFLPYLVMGNGVTMYENFVNSRQLKAYEEGGSDA